MESIKDVHCAIEQAKTRGYTSDELTCSSTGVTKLMMTSNFEDMIRQPAQHMSDKIVLILELDQHGRRILPKFVAKLPDPAPDGWFKKDGARIGSMISDPAVQSALARLYLHAAMNAPDFDPEVIPPAMQGLKEVWSLVQGVDSQTILDRVPGQGYESLRGVAKMATAVGPINVVGCHEFQTEDQVKDALVERVASMLHDAPGSFVTAQVLLPEGHSDNPTFPTATHDCVRLRRRSSIACAYSALRCSGRALKATVRAFRRMYASVCGS